MRKYPESAVAPSSPNAPSGPNPAGISFVSGVVRLAGLAVMAAGMYVGWQLVTVAWELFQNQDRVTTLGAEFETRSGVNGLFHALLEQRAPATRLPAADGAPPTGDLRPSGTALTVESKANTAANVPPQKDGGYREIVERTNVSYVCAWLLTFILLGIIGRLAMLAIITGGRLAMHQGPNLQEIRLLAREIVRASNRSSE